MGNTKNKNIDCQYDECKNKLTTDNIKNGIYFCVKHLCHKKECNEGIIKLGNYCKYHKCGYINCSRESYACGFCNMHSSFIKR